MKRHYVSGLVSSFGVVSLKEHGNNCIHKQQQQQQQCAFSTKTKVVENEDDEAVENGLQSGYTLLESMLTSGGDDRSLINVDTGTNKYHCKPQPIASDEIFRGSCTCNTPTERGYKAAEQLYERSFMNKSTKEVEDTLRTIFEDQRQRIAKCFELPDDAEIVLCPSGSDAEYIPVAIARAIQKEPSQQKIVNIVTQLKEIGAGSNWAAGGKYFSTHTPLLGKLPEGSNHTRLEGFDDSWLQPEITIPARERDGTVMDASTIANQHADQAKHVDGYYPILHGVFGGKTGLMDHQMPGSSPDGTSLGVVDACQGRFSNQELHEWIQQESIVLFTASKFYQAPPFCGAVFIPPNIANQLRSNQVVPSPTTMFGPLGLGSFLTDKELPSCLDHWKPYLCNQDGRKITNNIGLALRWEAGLVSMEALAQTPDEQRVQAVEQWAKHVTDMVQTQSENYLDAWCVQRSIVSIRLRRSLQNGNGNDWLNMKELRDVYRYMSKDVSSIDLPHGCTPEEKQILSTCCFVGQPVDVSESHAILRIALGSESLVSYIQDPTTTLRDDERTVQKLATIAKYFTTLQQSSF